MPNLDPYVAQELLSHQVFLRRLASDLVGKDAEDLVQDVWQRALERPPRHGRQLRGWLARVAHNLATNRWRSEARRTEREERRALEGPATGDLEARLELRKELVGALDALPPACREAVLLRYFEGLGPRDIASRQGAPVATVKTRLRRGLAQLREALDARHGGRARWMPAVTALAAPGGGVGSGTLVIGAMGMGTTMKVSAAVLVVATCLYLATRTSPAESPRMSAVGPAATEGEPADAAATSVAGDPAGQAEQRSPVADEPSGGAPAVRATRVLRVVLEGVTEEDARRARVTLTGADLRDRWPSKIRRSWACRGSTTELDLEPFLATVAAADLDSPIADLRVTVESPRHLTEVVRVPLSSGVELASGRTVYEVRVRPERPVFWPRFTLAVRDARTRAHLEDVELRFMRGAWMAAWGSNPEDASLADGLSSPIALAGGHGADEPGVVTGLALSPAAGGSPLYVELPQRVRPEQGVIVSARAPGYAWGSVSLDVSQSGAHEILLNPGSALDVRMSNVQPDRYAALAAQPVLCVYRIREDGGDQYVRFERLDEMLAADGLRLDGLDPGEYAVAVELGGEAWARRPVLAREELTVAAGETGEVFLALADPPASQARATLGGVVSFPAFGGEEHVQLELYAVGSDRWGSAAELSSTELERVGGGLPSWSFRIEELPVGLYQVRLAPFLKSWMIELPAGGAEDVELVIPELAEVLVETVDARTGRLLPLVDLKYGYGEVLPGQVNNRFGWADLELPGRFRFWTAPGPAYLQTNRLPPGYGWCREDLELVPGLQSVRLEVGPAYLIRFDLRLDGADLPRPDEAWSWVPYGYRAIRAVGHGGRALGSVERDVVEVTAPGLYEVGLEGLTADRFLPIPPRLVEVRPGETAEVIVELRRK